MNGAVIKGPVNERKIIMEKIYLKMKSIGITNIIFGVVSIAVGIISIWGGNSLLKNKHKLLF